LKGACIQVEFPRKAKSEGALLWHRLVKSTWKRQQQGIDKAVALWEDYKRRKASTRQGK
jgi:hypothetical protein